MTVVSTLEAQASLPALLERVADGEEISIESHGQLIAKLVGLEKIHPGANAVVNTIAKMRDFCSHHTTGGRSVREMLEEGRM